jgi:hypothetical protein
MAIQINPFGIGGGSGSDAVTYTLPSVSAGNQITAATAGTVAGVFNQEVVRRQGANPGFGTPSGLIYATNLNALKDALANAPYPYTNAVFTGVSSGSKIFATDLNNLCSLVYQAGQVCLCNCNYCTCNCNYCTCDCNYACTCNCNY